MAGYLIHLAVAAQAAKQLYPHDSTAFNAFCCGALYPDAFSDEQKDKSHYCPSPDRSQLFSLPDLEEFQNKHPGFRKNPFMYGYYVHLVTDNLFFKEFIQSRITVAGSRGDRRIVSKISPKLGKMKAADARTKLKEDYTRVNPSIVKRYGLEMPDAETVGIPDCFPDAPASDERRSKLKELFNTIVSYMKTMEQDQGDPQLFKLDDLQQWINETAQQCYHLCIRKYKRVEQLHLDVFYNRWRLYSHLACPFESVVVYYQYLFTTDTDVQKNDSSDLLLQWAQIWNEDTTAFHSFSRFFITSYNKLIRSAEYNKNYNFAAKKLFLWHVRLLAVLNAVVLAAYLLICFNIGQLHLNSGFLLAIETAFLLFGFLVLFPVARWIDVRKFQETWCRYRVFQLSVEEEMMKFIWHIPPYYKYNSPERNQVKFMERVLSAEENNKQTFQNLLTQKEKNLMDGFKMKV